MPPAFFPSSFFPNNLLIKLILFIELSINWLQSYENNQIFRIFAGENVLKPRKK